MTTVASPSLATELSHPRYFGRVASYCTSTNNPFLLIDTDESCLDNCCYYLGAILAVSATRRDVASRPDPAILRRGSRLAVSASHPTGPGDFPLYSRPFLPFFSSASSHCERSRNEPTPRVALNLALPSVPESPRWLMRNGRHAEAKHILLEYHANGAEQDDLVDFQIKEITQQ